jgi:formylmethanofuran dehydrogenase subunit E
MITLNRSQDEHIAACAVLHTRLCPKQVLGVRMARFACMQLDIDPDISRKQIFVFMECGRCAADAVIIVTGASPTNRLMQLMDYGKVAATFVNLQTGSALRVSENPESRNYAIQLMPDAPIWEAQRDAYQMMPDDHLLQWQPVRLLTPIPFITEKHSVHCEICGDRINEHCEVVTVTQVLCKACAFSPYYQSIERTDPCISKESICL